jgi:hypothetical protein
MGVRIPRQQTRQRASPRESVLKAKGKQRLQGMVDWGERERKKVMELLTTLPAEMDEERDLLLDRLDKLDTIIKQIKVRLEE